MESLWAHQGRPEILIQSAAEGIFGAGGLRQRRKFSRIPVGKALSWDEPQAHAVPLYSQATLQFPWCYK